MGTHLTGPAVAYNHGRLLFNYLKYVISASNGKGHGIHSPFLYAFVRQVLNDSTAYPDYARIEVFRKTLLKDKTVLEVDDFGAGPSRKSSALRTISSIARSAAKSPGLAQLLYRIARFYKPQHILELGTSLGISAAYLASGNPDAKLITCEGSAAIADKARQHLTSLHCNNTTVVTGNFDQTLPGVLQQLGRVDLAYIDGNHRLEPTLRYFEQIREYTTTDSILIFDDIHWSREMENAWEIIRNSPGVTASVDLFFLGFIFFRKEFKEPLHYTIRF